jgi:5-carboxymethyl-2-hydroxymuconate isomerase
MPHITLEYSRSLEDQMDVPALLTRLHNALASQPGIEKARIKTRGIPVNYELVGDGTGKRTMAHITLLLLAGRDTATRKVYGAALHQTALDAAPKDCAVTLEVREMDRDTYFL